MKITPEISAAIAGLITMFGAAVVRHFEKRRDRRRRARNTGYYN